MKITKITLSNIFRNWYSDFRINRSKELGCTPCTNEIFADFILQEFSLSLKFQINKNYSWIKKDMIKSFLYEIFRETSYCHEKHLVEENQCMNNNKLQGVLSNCFFTNCIYCDNLLDNVDFACIDKICENCEKLKYEIKSVSWSKYPPNSHFYKFGEISGVRKFLRNEENMVVLHTKTGYYYTTVKNIIKDKYTLFTIDDENIENRNISLENFVSFVEENEKRVKVNIKISGHLFVKYTNSNKALNINDVKTCFLQIFSIIDHYFKLPFKKNKNFKSLKDVEDTIIQFKL